MSKKPKIGEFHVTAKYKGDEKEREFFHLVDFDRVNNAPKEELEKDIKEKLNLVSPKPTSGIYKMFVSHSLVRPDDLISLEYANMLIEANIPYCLHLPTNIEIEVALPERNIKL